MCMCDHDPPSFPGCGPHLLGHHTAGAGHRWGGGEGGGGVARAGAALLQSPGDSLSGNFFETFFFLKFGFYLMFRD